MRVNCRTRVLGWPSYRDYRREIDEDAEGPKPWVRRKPDLPQMGVDDIFVSRNQKVIRKVSNLETPEFLWFGQNRRRRRSTSSSPGS
jgi:hypothetical protein